jgi:hypothetical protein
MQVWVAFLHSSRRCSITPSWGRMQMLTRVFELVIGTGSLCQRGAL